MVRNDETIIISHTHWDREWYLPFQLFRFRLVEMVDQLIDLGEKEREFKFMLDGQTIILDCAPLPRRLPPGTKGGSQASAIELFFLGFADSGDRCSCTRDRGKRTSLNFSPEREDRQQPVSAEQTATALAVMRSACPWCWECRPCADRLRRPSAKLELHT